MSRREIGLRMGHAQLGPCGAHPQPLRQGPRLGGAHALPGPRLPAWHGNIWTENIYYFDRALPMRRAGVAQAWPTGGPPVVHLWPTRGLPVAHPALVNMSRLGREQFRATWMPYLPDRPEIFPSLA